MLVYLSVCFGCVLLSPLNTVGCSQWFSVGIVCVCVIAVSGLFWGLSGVFEDCLVCVPNMLCIRGGWMGGQAHGNGWNGIMEWNFVFDTIPFTPFQPLLWAILPRPAFARVCVCVCEMERERARENWEQNVSLVHSAFVCASVDGSWLLCVCAQA